MEKIRQPKSFQDRIIQTFLSEENSEYLYNLLYYNLIKMNFSPNTARGILNAFIPDMIAFSSSRDGIYSILNSDELAVRTSLQYGLNVWDEVKRLNIIFYQNKMNNYINNVYSPKPQQLKPPLPSYNKLLEHVPIDGAVEDNDDYAMKMFISDSLQPEGYEYLNDMGPKYELLENQHKWGNKNGTNRDKYDMGGNNSTIGNEDDSIDFDVTLAMALTAPVNPNAQFRTAEDAIMEVMGENYVSSETAIKSKNANKSNIIGSENEAFMRYKEIPFWQHLSREGVDTDIGETLGFGMIETGNHVRGWDMSELREKNSKRYPRYY
uniref:Uncharacterized protein n=1 Tax=viral metagenome TaxID=1070528 RepID=A0A6C0I158_9ZZZZ